MVPYLLSLNQKLNINISFYMMKTNKYLSADNTPEPTLSKVKNYSNI